MSYLVKEGKLAVLLSIFVLFTVVSSAYCETLNFPDEYSAIVEAINTPQEALYAASQEVTQRCSLCHGDIFITQHHEWIPTLQQAGDPSSPYNPYCPDPPPTGSSSCISCHFNYDDNCQSEGFVVRISNGCVACHAMSETSHDSVLVLAEQCIEVVVPGACFVQPEVMIQNLIDTVLSLNLQQGISNSMDAKLEAALSALDDTNSNNDVAATNSLNALINAIEAQRGGKITDEDADNLIADVQAIINALQS